MTERATDPAVLFDLDGTLLRFDDYGAVVEGAFHTECGRCEEAWAVDFGDRFFEAFGALEPTPYRRAFAGTCERFDLDADPDALVAAIVDHECDLSAVPPGVRETLADLADAGHPLGVCSNGVRRVQRAKLAANDLLAPFTVVLTSYNVGAHKPDPAIFERARDRIGASEYVMVGDSDDDVEGARAAGMAALQVETGDEDDASFPSAVEVLDAL
ncbi:HAD family hydrolase [Halomarina salina]|uniref:HAD family hydrolase n=1 Tax=Halomarina salina TaxID=1872699 RepID=A0ABD5RN92_9EURY|nr:HAD family hydrolase [Halomarina salina]